MDLVFYLTIAMMAAIVIIRDYHYRFVSPKH